MEALFILLVGAPLVALALLGHIGFFLTLGARRRLSILEFQFGQARQRIVELEGKLAAGAPAEKAAEAPPAPALREVDEAPPAPEPFAPTPEATEAPVPPAPAKPRRSLEETLGAHWTVWVGGVALALGAALMVRWSIENGLFGPAARIILGLGFSATLVIVGEVLRRSQGALLPGSAAARANAPAALAGAGVVGAFASIFAAHALYHFLDATFAFLALGGVSFAALVFASLHGPALAGLGLLGALATPLLVTSDNPSPWPVLLYLIVVGAANQTMARLRRWLWLALAASAGGLGWCWLLFMQALQTGSTPFYQAALLSTVAHAALAAWFFGVAPHRERREEAGAQDPFALGVLALHAGLAVVLFNAAPAFAGADAVWLAAAALIVAALAAAAYLSTPAASAAALAGLAVLGVLAVWPAAATNLRPALITVLSEWRWPPPQDARAFLTYALLVALGVAAIAGRRLLASRGLAILPAALYAGAATLTPLGALMIVDVRLAEGHASAEMATVAAVLAGLFVGAANLFQRRAGADPALRLGLGAFASAAIGALASGLVFALDGGMLTAALALAALGTAYVELRLDIPLMRWAAAGLGVVIGARLAWNPRVMGDALSTTPIFNGLLLGYGVPAASFFYAARLMRRRGEDTPVRIADALAVLFAAFLVFFEIRHFTNGGDPFARTSGLVELGLQAVSAFGFALVLTRLDAARRNPVFRVASLAAGAIGALIVAGGLFVYANPLLTSENVEGGRFLNALLIAYLLPAALAAALCYFARGVRPGWYWRGAGWLSALLAAAYVVMEARVIVHGAGIGIFKDFTVFELGLDAVAALLAALAFDLFERGRQAMIAFRAAAFVGLAGLAGIANPLWSGIGVGDGLFFNTLLIGYLAPAALAVALARRTKSAETRVAAILWIFAYVSLETRRFFQPPRLDLDHGFVDAELYAYSAIWLLLGVALLVYGVRRGAREVRLASAFFVIASTVKVFLVDFSGLEGMYRAVSFIGLGAALIGVGLVYQRFVFAPRPSEPVSPG